jgi:iron complex transport system permease protein
MINHANCNNFFMESMPSPTDNTYEEISYLMNIKRKSRIIGFICLCLLILLICLATNMGEARISFGQIIRIILGKLTFRPFLYSDVVAGFVSIVWDIRLPRILSAVLVGAGLSVAGAIFQALLMNPLADPYTLGISTGAAFGASLSIYFSVILGIAFLPVLPAAFIFAMITLIVVILMANRSSGLNASNLIISGIIVGSVLSAGITFIKNAAGEDVAAIVFWLMGNLSARTWSDVLILFPFTFVGCMICFYYSNEINILCMGDENAKKLGVNVKRTRWILLITASLMTAACVSVSGIIGFVGLVVPHLLRFGLTSNNQYLLPLSALLGGLLLMVADNITRILFVSEIPVGVLTTLIGGPFFMFLFTRRNGKGDVKP